ncbi:hypothetical protein DB771_01140 [Burkholderia sp. AU29985]|nr:hypothetical protein EGY28_24410 [Burkholderia dolosa]PRE48917.1 hypothetical protein C6P87_15570 [Burkholderia sp. AU12872]PUA78769.1 hypothetical protein DB771_01140 [Burkholderia sp. AU29985]
MKLFYSLHSPRVIESVAYPDAHPIHESGRIIRRATAMKNRRARQIIIAKSAVRQIVAGRFRAAARVGRIARRTTIDACATAASQRDASRMHAAAAISRARTRPASARRNRLAAASNDSRRRSAGRRSDRSRR